MKELQTNKYFYASGRRKTSIASVRLFEGKNESTINGKPLKEFYFHDIDRKFVVKPLKVVELNDKYYFTAKVKGGGVSAQKEAVRLALAKSITVMDEEFKTPLRKADLMTRDNRMVERKHTGFIKARKSPQYSKR